MTPPKAPRRKEINAINLDGKCCASRGDGSINLGMVTGQERVVFRRRFQRHSALLLPQNVAAFLLEESQIDLAGTTVLGVAARGAAGG